MVRRRHAQASRQGACQPRTGHRASVAVALSYARRPRERATVQGLCQGGRQGLRNCRAIMTFDRAKKIVADNYGEITEQSSNELMIELPAPNAIGGAPQLTSAGYAVTFIGTETRWKPRLRMRSVMGGAVQAVET